MQEEDTVEDQGSAPTASCVHGSMETLKLVLLLLLSSLKEKAIPEDIWARDWVAKISLLFLS